MVKIIESLAKRRSYYAIGKGLPVPDGEVVKAVQELTELVPDAFNMKSSRVVVVLGEHQDALWDAIYDAFGGKVAREKIDSFKAGHGTVLYFYDNDVVKALQDRFPNYAPQFLLWANQSAGMLQISVWSALREMNIGASIQHYNPVIDDAVKKLFDLPRSWVLNAQMPFGRILQEPDPKEREDINERVRVVR